MENTYLVKDNPAVSEGIDDICYYIESMLDDLQPVDLEFRNIISDIYDNEFDLGYTQAGDTLIYDCSDTEEDIRYAIKYQYEIMLERIKDVYASAAKRIDRMIYDLDNLEIILSSQ